MRLDHTNRTFPAVALVALAGLLVPALTAAAAPAARRWQVNAAAGTVLDKRSGLLWQRAAPTTGGTAGSNTGRFEYADAASYCANLALGGYADWRVPTLQELRSLVDRKRTMPSISPTVFPITPVSGVPTYWSSTLQRDKTTVYWTVSFYDGASLAQLGTVNLLRVRCVRTPGT